MINEVDNTRSTNLSGSSLHLGLYFYLTDNVPSKTGDESEETTSLSVNGQRASDYKRSAPQTERLTSIEEKQAEDVFNTDQL